MIRAILACDDDWGIGKDGDLPWPHNPADLKWFKENTSGGVVAMGKATWDSLPIKPLPNRDNIVITRSDHDTDVYGIDYHFINFDKAKIDLVDMSDLQNVWVIGGAQLVSGLLSIIDEIWLSRIKGTYGCDIFLPRDIIESTFELFSSQKEGDVYIDKWRSY